MRSPLRGDTSVEVSLAAPATAHLTLLGSGRPGPRDERSSTMTTAEQDKEAIISIVREMAESMTGAQTTRHWAPDVLWVDIPPFASRGVPPARKLFDDTFANFESCTVDILELDATVNGDMASSARCRAPTSCSRAAPPSTSLRGKPTASNGERTAGN